MKLIGGGVLSTGPTPSSFIHAIKNHKFSAQSLKPWNILDCKEFFWTKIDAIIGFLQFTLNHAPVTAL